MDCQLIIKHVKPGVRQCARPKILTTEGSPGNVFPPMPNLNQIWPCFCFQPVHTTRLCLVLFYTSFAHAIYCTFTPWAATTHRQLIGSVPAPSQSILLLPGQQQQQQRQRQGHATCEELLQLPTLTTIAPPHSNAVLCTPTHQQQAGMAEASTPTQHSTHQHQHQHDAPHALQGSTRPMQQEHLLSAEKTLMFSPGLVRPGLHACRRKVGESNCVLLKHLICHHAYFA